MDSFGVEPDERTIKFLKGSNKKLAYNDSQFQDMNSSRCGWYVKHWLTDMANGKTMRQSLYDSFTQHPSKHNEELVIN